MTERALETASARMLACRTAGSTESLHEAIRRLSDPEASKLARSLEFEAILDGEQPEVLEFLRQRLRAVRPPRVLSVERRCWIPVQRFLSDRKTIEPRAPWILPRRLLKPLWKAIEKKNGELIDQLSRRMLIALFDDDVVEMERIGIQVGDVAAFYLNNTEVLRQAALEPTDKDSVQFMARVLKWHRLIMPNVRYFQQVMMARAAGEGRSTVDNLRLHSNWFTVYELLEQQFDLYVLYLFEMTESPIDVIDAFPFYFGSLERTDGLDVMWLMWRCDQHAAGIADIMTRPLRSLPSERMFELFDSINNLNRLIDRIARVPFLARRTAGGQPVIPGLFDSLQRRVPPDAVERAVDAYLDDLHDLMEGTPERQARSQRIMARFSIALPVLLALVDSGDKVSRAARARFRLGESSLESINRFLKNMEMAPATRKALAPQIAGTLDMCRRFGLGEDVEALLRRLNR